MGNPTITRLGIQQFWYHHWYSDSSTALNLQQDKLFENLLNTYLTYGLRVQNNLFIHEYWYSNKKNFKNTRVNFKNSKHHLFYRRYHYLNNIVGIEHNFLLRNTTAEYFPLRLWLFKYNNWIILNVTWFKPLKGKNKLSKNRMSASAANALHKTTSHFFKSYRLKLLLIFFLSQVQTQVKEYNF